MRVIVTRPRRQGERTATRLAELGHEALLLPLTRPVHDLKVARDALAMSQGAIAVTSAEAIHALQAIGPLTSADLSRPLFAVGMATASQAEKAGFRSAYHGDGNGVQLADLISDNPALLGGRSLTYLAGSPRADGFETRLTELGIPFETVECYRMEDIEPDEEELRKLLFDRAADAILLYSRHTTERFFSLPFVESHRPIAAGTRLLCLSEAIAAAVPHFLHSNVEIPATPDEESLLTLLDAA
jgi:uroporphyrinogen-III synthase